MLHVASEIKAAQTVQLGGSKDTLISSAVDFPATRKSCLTDKESRTTEAETFSSQPGMFSSLSDAALGRVQGQVDGARERNLPCSSHLQLSTSTEGRPWQSSRCCLHRMAGTAWQSTHAGRSSMPEAACSTWKQIKPAWCTATTVNMPGQERQRGRSPTEPLLGCCSGSGC